MFSFTSMKIVNVNQCSKIPEGVLNNIMYVNLNYIKDPTSLNCNPEFIPQID